MPTIIAKRLLPCLLLVVTAAGCLTLDESGETAESEAVGEAESALDNSNTCIAHPELCVDPTTLFKTCYQRCSSCSTSLGDGYAYSDTTPNSVVPDGFSGNNWGTGNIVTVTPNTMAPSYSTLSLAQQRDVVAFMNNSAMSYGANKATLNYHQTNPIAVKGGYYKWYTQTGNGGYHYAVYWNAKRNCAYLATNYPMWHGAQANLFTKYSQVGYQDGALGLPASNPMGNIWGSSWQRFENGYITNRSTGYNDMTFRTYHVAGSSGVDKAIRERYGALFDVGSNQNNAWPLSQDMGCVNWVAPGMCGFGMVGKTIKALGPFNYELTVTATKNATTAFSVRGEIGNKWYQVSGATPQLGIVGWPKSEEIEKNGLIIQNFANGDITWNGTVASWIPTGDCSACTWESHPDQQCNANGAPSTCGLSGRSNNPVRVAFMLESGARQLVSGTDGGHYEDYCTIKDWEWDACSEADKSAGDGLQLRPDPSGAWAVGNPDLPTIGDIGITAIEGPYQLENYKWEWQEHLWGEWTYRRSDLVYLLFENVHGAQSYAGNMTFYWDEDDAIGDDDYNWTGSIGPWLTDCLAGATEPNVYYTSLADQQIANTPTGYFCADGGSDCDAGKYDVRFDVICRFEYP
jgi:hypothetical protein